MADPAPIPIGTESHLQVLFDKLYESYGRDPIKVPAISWILNPGSAYLRVSGATATVVMTSLSTTQEQDFNLVNDGNGNRPTLSDFKTWLNERFTSFFGAGFTISWYPGYSTTSISALALVEDHTDVGFSIQVATAPNYLQMRVMSLVFDLLSSDTENFFSHLAIAGLDNFSSSPTVGMWLDWVGSFYGIHRFNTRGNIESNDSYKRRILRLLSQPRENNTAVANIVSQSIGVAGVSIIDYRTFWALLIVFGSIPDPSIPLPLAKSVAPAGIRWTGIDIPTTSGDIGGAIAGRVRAGNSGIEYSSSRPNSYRRREGYTSNQPARNVYSTSDYWDDQVAIPLNGFFAVLN